MTAPDRTVASSDEDVQILVEVNGEAWTRVDNFKSSGLVAETLTVSESRPR
jgi:hypothetical protein